VQVREFGCRLLIRGIGARLQVWVRVQGCVCARVQTLVGCGWGLGLNEGDLDEKKKEKVLAKREREVEWTLKKKTKKVAEKELQPLEEKGVLCNHTTNDYVS
jgi:hypothetical protein